MNSEKEEIIHSISTRLRRIDDEKKSLEKLTEVIKNNMSEAIPVSYSSTGYSRSAVFSRTRLLSFIHEEILSLEHERAKLLEEILLTKEI